MKVSDLLIIMLFLAVILYRVYKSQKEKKASKKENQLDVIDVNRNPYTAEKNLPLHRIYVQAIECDKTDSADMVASNVTHAVTQYLESIDSMNAERPQNIGFFTSYNRIFITYKW